MHNFRRRSDGGSNGVTNGSGGRQARLGPSYPPGFVGTTYGYGFPGLENPWDEGYGDNSGNPPGTLPPGYRSQMPGPPGRGIGPDGVPGGTRDFVAGYQRSDALLRDDARDRLDHDPFLHGADIQVRVDNAEITLTGTVQNRAQKRRARDLADAVHGVIDVHNRLTIANLHA